LTDGRNVTAVQEKAGVCVQSVLLSRSLPYMICSLVFSEFVTTEGPKCSVILLVNSVGYL